MTCALFCVFCFLCAQRLTLEESTSDQQKMVEEKEELAMVT